MANLVKKYPLLEQAPHPTVVGKMEWAYNTGQAVRAKNRSELGKYISHITGRINENSRSQCTGMWRLYEQLGNLDDAPAPNKIQQKKT